MKVALKRTGFDLAMKYWGDLAGIGLLGMAFTGLPVPTWGLMFYAALLWGQMARLVWRDASEKKAHG